LHVQLIVDALEQAGDFPGVAFASEREVWTSLSPNPSDFVGIDDGLSVSCHVAACESTLHERRHSIGPSLTVAYRQPLSIVRGWMQYLFDDRGRRFLDAYNNVPHVGHCHPRVVQAAGRQMTTLNTNTRYLHGLLQEFAGRIADTLPDPLQVCYFVNSASEANELALRLVRTATGRQGMIVHESAYHGHTSTLIDISPYKHDGPGGQGTPEWVHKLPLPDRYRGLFRGQDRAAEYAADAAMKIARYADSPFPPAALIAETCPSVAGQIFPPDNYYTIVYEAARAIGALTIADEVQTGFGRLGTHFWAFEKYGVVPDIVVMGKPMGNGHPIAAVVTTPAIADRFNNGMEFFSTFGGNTVSCAVGIAVLDVLRDEKLQARALATGSVLEVGFHELAARHPMIGDVRGSGLFWGLELVRSQETLEAADAEAALISNRMREFGVLIGTDGPLHNVLKVRPPMQFNRDNAETLVEVLGSILNDEFAGDFSRT
jgi:4-aminobutyrate aminotransferase-like enzyme